MDEIRIGVYVCHCGTNIDGVLDCEKLKEYAMNLPNVVHAENNLYTCSETGLAQIKEGIINYSLNRVIVASCTPRTHEPLFRATCKEAGLNPFLFHFVNIRDQCSWVHANNPEKAQEKAKDLIKMGVSRAELLKPLENIYVGVTPAVLIIGGGIAGMKAGMTLGNQGYKVIIIEKEKELGGNLKNLYKLFPTNQDATEILKIRDKLLDNDNISVFTSSILKNVDGFVGNYEIEVRTEKEDMKYKVGCIIIATGTRIFKPTNYYNYNGQNIITQLELEQILKKGKINANNIIMIQCVGSRIKDREYCSNVCCRTAIKNSMIIKESNPNSNIIILNRDIQASGVLHELNYRKARENGIIFIKYSKDRQPVIEGNVIKVFNLLINKEIKIPYDLIVLSTPMIANENSKDLAQMLKVPQDEYGFFLEAHVKLRPVDFATDGIFVCGCAHWPVDVSTSISQAYATASRAGTFLSKEKIEIEGAIATVDKEICIGCEVCIKLCPYNAIYKDENDEIVINEVLCKGCGVCGASCIKNAISIRHFTNNQILSQIIALGGE